MILLLLGSLCVSFLFTGIESGLFALNRVRLRHHARLNERNAARLERLLQKPEHLLLTVSVVTAVANATALVVLVRLLKEPFGLAGYPLAFLLAVPIWVVGLGMIPRAVFRRFPFRTLIRFARLLGFAAVLLSPLLFLVEHFFRPLFRGRLERATSASALREEIRFHIRQSEEAGHFTATERGLFNRILDFRDIHIGEIMIPWSNVVSIDLSTPLPEVVATARRTDFDRLPVLHNGEPVGLLRIFDPLLDPAATGKSVADYMRHLVRCRPDDSVLKVVRQLRAARVSLAVVCNENDMPVGISTIEELISHILAGRLSVKY